MKAAESYALKGYAITLTGQSYWVTKTEGKSGKVLAVTSDREKAIAAFVAAVKGER